MKPRPLYRCTNCHQKVGRNPPDVCSICHTKTFEPYKRFQFSIARLLVVMSVVCIYLGITQSWTPPFIDPFILMVFGDPLTIMSGASLCLLLLPSIFAVAFRPNLWTYLLCLFGLSFWWLISYAMYTTSIY